MEGQGTCKRSCFHCWKYYVLDTIGDDWLFCLLLGISMALISFAMDFCILKLQVYNALINFLDDRMMSCMLFSLYSL